MACYQEIHIHLNFRKDYFLLITFSGATRKWSFKTGTYSSSSKNLRPQFESKHLQNQCHTPKFESMFPANTEF